jgi:hypothetical protein
MTAEIDPGDTNSPNPKTKEGALFCYALIRGGIKKSPLFAMNTALFCI